MVVSVQIPDDDLPKLQDLTRQCDASEAIRVAIEEFMRYTRWMQLKELSGRVEMIEKVQEF